MGVESFTALRQCPAPRRGWRRASRPRVGPLRTVAEAGLHPILRGIRNGALLGFALVAVLGLPVLLILGVRSPPPPETRVPIRNSPPAREAAIRLRAEAPAAPPVAVPAEAAPVPLVPARASAAEARPVLGLDLIPVLDDPSAMFAPDEPPVVKPARQTRAAAPARSARTP